MSKEGIIREICTAIPLTCPKCQIGFRGDRIDLKRISKGRWFIWALCGSCNSCSSFTVETNHPNIRSAINLVCGDRGLGEEARLRASGEIPPFYEKELSNVLEKWWQHGPKDDPHPPVTRS